MATTIKEIGNAGEFHIRFIKTKIFKRSYGSEEVLLAEFDYNPFDEFPSEIIWMPSIGRGLWTWFNFNKVEKFEYYDVIDYHRNLFLSPWEYSVKPDDDLEMVNANLPGSLFDVSIIKVQGKYFVHILISYEDHYFRIEYSEPMEDSFSNPEKLIDFYNDSEIDFQTNKSEGFFESFRNNFQKLRQKLLDLPLNMRYSCDVYKSNGENLINNENGNIRVSADEIILETYDNSGDYICLLYTSPSPRDRTRSRMPSSA